MPFILAFLSGFFPADVAPPRPTEANVPVEIAFTADRDNADPFHQVTLDVVFTGPDGTARRVPAFWAGGKTWKVRYASPLPGRHAWVSEANVPADKGLHGVRGQLEVRPYRGDNPLFARGPVRVTPGRRHLEYGDGTPFFWLGDTWWMGLCHRLHWPDEFRTLAADRKAKGFNVVQVVAGLYPDMPPFDPRGANEAGFPWEKDYARIRPEYFDAADRRLWHLVEQGFTPCLVGAWGYFLPWTGEAKMKQHWRYLIARYGAWPVVWCVAGEANLPWYLAKGFPYDDREQVRGWTEVARYVRATDPFRRPLTIHPTAINRYTARHAIGDPGLLDFDMLQTPHGQREAVGTTIQAVRDSYAARPVLPVINGEAAYEKLSDTLPTQWTRAMFWFCVTSGTAGHTYGANGIWQCNRKGQPHGASPHGGSYGVIPWDEAMNLPGSGQLGAARKFLEGYPWHRCEPHPEWAAWAEARPGPPWGSWVWYPEGDPKRDAPVAARAFRRTFEAPARPRRAVLHISADDSFQAWLNGQEVGRGAGWNAPRQLDATALVREGRNVLAVRAENGPAPVKENPAGLIAVLVLEAADGKVVAVPTDDAWRTGQTFPKGWTTDVFDDRSWPRVRVLGRHGDAPWGRLDRDDPLFAPTAIGIPGALRIVYVPEARPVALTGLSPGALWRVTRFDPVEGKAAAPVDQKSGPDGRLVVPAPSHDHDWVLVVEAAANR